MRGSLLNESWSFMVVFVRPAFLKNNAKISDLTTSTMLTLMMKYLNVQVRFKYN